MPFREMSPGDRRHLVTVQTKKVTQNSYNEEEVTWVDDSEVWVSIKPIMGKEYFAERQVQSVVTHRISMLYMTLQNGDAINSNCRILFNDRAFEIVSVINVEERNAVLQLMCTEAIK